MTLEKRAYFPYANLKPLAEIADGIDALIREDPNQDGISVAELGAYENHNLTPRLAVTGAEYKPMRPEYHTKSSVIGRIALDVSMSAGGEYSYFDIDPLELANVESVSYSSEIVDELPVLEVKRQRGELLLDEVRQQVLAEVRRQQVFLDEVDLGSEARRQVFLAEVDPGSYPPQLETRRFFSQYRVSMYNEDGGYTVCNNEEIYKILRKKKDGKCIYRIVVKNGVRANRIHHGKHRKCIMYMDQKDPSS